MNTDNQNHDEIQRRSLQEYIFCLEEVKEEAEDLAVEHEQLKRTQELLNAILDATTHGIALIRKTKFGWCNKGLTDILGWENDELVGKTARVLFPDTETFDSMNKSIHMHTAKTGVIDFESDLLHKNGARIPCLITHRPLDTCNLSKGCIVSFTDFSERKRAQDALKKANDELENRVKERTEELDKINEKLKLELSERKRIEVSLRESEEKYRTVLEGSPDPVVVYDMEGKVIYFNPAFTRVFGWTLEERFGKKLDDYVPEETWRETENMIEMARSGENFSGIETIRYSKKRRIIHVSISGAIYRNQEGNPIGSVAILRDITEQKKLEAQLEQAHKMEAIGTLAGGVAHDLNNILSGIVSYPDLLLMQIPEDSPLRKPIMVIQQSGKKAADVVQDLLTLARRGVAIKETVNLNDVITEYLDSPEHEKLISYHPKIQINTDLEADLLNILGSPIHLSKTIMNLVSNAAEAMPYGGKVYISAENRYIDRSTNDNSHVPEGEYVVLTVSDSGIGISPEDIKKIFEPFYTKKVMGRSGTGLGMSVVWGTVKDHDGYIDVKSAEGKGTTLKLYFVTTRKNISSEKDLTSIEDYMGKGESILVVDDVKEQREIAYSILDMLRYEVNTVSSGEKALDYMQSNKADLLILDMIMDPGMDGLDTYKEILKLHPEQKAIIASGFSETDRVKHVQQLGAGQYVKKPYTLDKIGIAVRDELARHRQHKL